MSKLLKWIVNIILLAAIVVAGALLIPPLMGITTVIVDDLDMDTNLSKGSVTYAVDKSVKELETGNNILIESSESAFVYKLKSIDTSTGSCEMEDVKSSDGTARTETFRSNVSKVVLTIPFIGYVVMAMKSTEGIIIIALAVIFVIILFILAELWKTDDNEPEEEEDIEAAYEAENFAPANVDVSSQIMEEVSSEIASVVSSVVTEEATMPTEEIPNEEKEIETVVEIVTEEEDAEGTSEKEFEGAEKTEEVEEAEALSDVNQNETAQDESQDPAEKESEEAENSEEILEVLPEELEEEIQEEISEEEEIELAMPIYTAEELIQKAKDAGDEPEVIQDEEAGITLLDYSDIL